MTTTGSDATCDTHDMVVVHRVFRREFALIPQLVRATPEDDTEQAAIVAAHAREMMRMLHHHHTAEDELLWPLLRERAELERDLVRRMETQHRDIAALVAPVDSALRAWVDSADVDSRDQLAALLTSLSAALAEHLHDEETGVLPIVEHTVAAAEWRRLAERGMTAMPRPRLLVFLGHILEEADEGERREFLRHVPVPARVAYRVVGRSRYIRESTRQRRDLQTHAA